jgi:hypothetical protein
MSGYQSFAVWGAGDIGKPIINELLLRGMSTTVLTRPVSGSSTHHSRFHYSHLFILF